MAEGPRGRHEPGAPADLPGAHSALFSVLGQVARPGDTICAERITYPGIRALAAHLGLRLVDLPMDRHGVDPDAFAAACTKVAPKAIYLNPLLQNPTTATLSRTRREAIIAVARRYAVSIIEDDAYARILPGTAAELRRTRAEITYYVAGVAKCLGAGLRLAFLVTPSARSALPVAGALRAATVMASPISTALATRWIMDGTAEAIVQFVREESAARQRIVASLLPAETYTADPHGFHVWITLPDGWTRSAFASQGRSAGLGVVGSDPFCVAGTPPEAVRLCLGAPRPGSRSRTAWKCLRTRSKGRRRWPRPISEAPGSDAARPPPGAYRARPTVTGFSDSWAWSDRGSGRQPAFSHIFRMPATTPSERTLPAHSEANHTRRRHKGAGWRGAEVVPISDTPPRRPSRGRPSTSRPCRPG